MSDVVPIPHEGRTVDKPQNWDLAVSAAYLRLLGASQLHAAKVVGVDRSTVGNWERSAWWKDAKAEATDRWLPKLVEDAMFGLERGVRQDGRLALTVLERIVRELRPLPQQVQDVTEPTGDDPREFIRSALHGIRARTGTD